VGDHEDDSEEGQSGPSVSSQPETKSTKIWRDNQKQPKILAFQGNLKPGYINMTSYSGNCAHCWQMTCGLTKELYEHRLIRQQKQADAPPQQSGGSSSFKKKSSISGGKKRRSSKRNPVITNFNNLPYK